MITRLNGRYSTLAANPAPRRRRATKRNPSALDKALAAQERANKRAQKLMDRIAELEQKAKDKAKRARDKTKTDSDRKKAAAARAKTRKTRLRRAETKRSTKALRKTVRAGRRTAASKTYKVSPAGRKSYRMKKIPSGSAVGYVYKMRKKVGVTKSGKPRYETKYLTRKTPGGTKPPYAIVKDGNTFKLHKNPGRRKRTMKRKNAGLVVAGVPVIEMAIGSVGAIGVGALSEALIKKYAGTAVPAPLQDIVGEVATAAIAAFAHGKLKNKMHKDIAQFAFIGAVFGLISKKANDPIVNAIQKALPGETGGSYFDPSMAGLYVDPAGSGAVGGMYLNDQSAAPAMGASHAGHMSGMGLFEGRSIYG